MSFCVPVRWKETVSKGSMPFRRVVIVGIVVILLCFYIVNTMWLPRILIAKSSRDNTRPYKHLYVQFPGPAANLTLTFHMDTRLPMSPDHVMLITLYNASPHTQHRLTFKGCEHRCALTNDSAAADLLYINAGQLSPRLHLPSPRKKDQIWLLYSREPPSFPRFSYLNRPDLRSQINWTRAIFSDATFPLVYGILQRGNPPERDFDAIYESKVHSVAWFVGHCETKSLREEYVRRMTSRIDVHIYGECGNMTCGGRGYRMGGYMDECLEMLSRKYKFYLAFENSFCDNYVTEKFFNLFRSSMPTDVIPVVRGGADYRKLFDPEILVDAADFRSPEDLADYLSDLASDKGRYVAMVKHKSRALSTQEGHHSVCYTAFS